MDELKDMVMKCDVCGHEKHSHLGGEHPCCIKRHCVCINFTPKPREEQLPKLEEIDPDVISLVTFTANDIAKTKGWATTLKPDEVKLVLQTVRLIGALQEAKRGRR